MLKIGIHDEIHLQAVAKKLTPALMRVIKTGVMAIEADAKARAPVDVGRLRSSISHDVEGSPGAGAVVGRVGTNVNYAPFEEYGTGQIGKRTAQAQGVYAPSWYQYGPKFGHYVPLERAPGLRLWLTRVAGYRLVPAGGGRYDIYRGTNIMIRRATKYWYVRGVAHPFLTPAFMRRKDRIFKDIEAAIMKSFD